MALFQTQFHSSFGQRDVQVRATAFGLIVWREPKLNLMKQCNGVWLFRQNDRQLSSVLIHPASLEKATMTSEQVLTNQMYQDKSRFRNVRQSLHSKCNVPKLDLEFLPCASTGAR